MHLYEDIDTNFTEKAIRETLAKSNAKMKEQGYPAAEMGYIADCLTVQKCECNPETCACALLRKNAGHVGCQLTYSLRSDLDFDTFLLHAPKLWKSNATIHTITELLTKLENALAQNTKLGRDDLGGNEMAYLIVALLAVRIHWSGYNGIKPLPSFANATKRTMLCFDAYKITHKLVKSLSEKYYEIIRTTIKDKGDSVSGVYLSKMVSQIFYDIYIPHDTRSKSAMRPFDASMFGRDMRDWLLSTMLANKWDIGDIRDFDNASSDYWETHGATRDKVIDLFGQWNTKYIIKRTGKIPAPLSRIVDKMFYGH